MHTTTLHQDGFIGTLYQPDTVKKGPGIMLLSGSDGGMPGSNAIGMECITHLVIHGFTVLSVAYFGIKPLPEHLENIPIECFMKAISWLRPQVTRLSLLGLSRGGELALILGSHFAHACDAIVAVAPSSRVFGGFPHPNRPAWAYQGSAITPFIPGLNEGMDTTEADDIKSLTPKQANTQEEPCVIRELFTQRLLQHDKTFAAIEVEKIDCPLLLLSGDEDAIWPSTIFCEEVVKRLKEKTSPINCKHIAYQNRGHGLLSSYGGPMYHPVGKFWCTLGGQVEDMPQAWLDIVEFLQHTE